MNSREDWLREKQGCIGAADVAAILGEDPFQAPFHVYVAKVHGYSQNDSKQLTMGRLFERPIGQMYSLETGREILGEEKNETEIQYHSDIPWIGATLDDITSGSENNPNPWSDDSTGPLELKNSSGFTWRDGKWVKVTASEWAENPPVSYRIQNQVQMACMDSKWGSLAALFPNVQIAWTDLERNDKFLEAAYPKLEQFWQAVQRREAPSLSDLPSTLEVVKKMYPEETGDTVDLSEDDEKLVREWVTNREETSKLAKRKKFLEAQIRYKMKDATFAPVRSMGKFLTLKTTRTKGYTRVVEPGEYRVLRIAKKK